MALDATKPDTREREAAEREYEAALVAFGWSRKSTDKLGNYARRRNIVDC
jgi:hypothetical protein